MDAAGYRLRRLSRYMGQMLGADPEALEGKTADDYLKCWQTFPALR